MTAVILLFPRPQPTAFIERIGSEYRITLRNGAAAHSERRYTFGDDGETAERAIVLRDCGNWTLGYGPGTTCVRTIVAEIDGGAA